MKKILLVSLGGTVGYILGARAGRPAYDRIVVRWNGAASALGFEKLAATATEAGADVRDSAMSRLSSAVSTSVDSIVDHLDPDASAADPSPLRGAEKSAAASLGEDRTPLDPSIRR